MSENNMLVTASSSRSQTIDAVWVESADEGEEVGSLLIAAIGPFEDTSINGWPRDGRTDDEVLSVVRGAYRRAFPTQRYRARVHGTPEEFIHALSGEGLIEAVDFLDAFSASVFAGEVPA